MRVSAFAAVLALFATPAAAQPPPSGWVGTLATPSILCDTQAQLQSIVSAFGEGVTAGKKRFAELFRTMDNKREPACAVVAVNLAKAVESTSLGRVSLAGTDVFGWIVHVTNDAGDGYYLYLESPSDALRDTI